MQAKQSVAKPWRALIAACIGLAYTILSVNTALADPTTLRIGSGVDGNLYSDFANLLSKQVAEQDLEIQVVPVVTEGSVENFELMREGAIEIALVQSDVAYNTYEGVGQTSRFTGFRLAYLLFPEYFQLIVRSDSDVEVLGDLRQKSISLGPNGSGSSRTGKTLLNEIGMQSGVDYREAALEISDGIELLIAGELDAVIHVAGSPPEAYTDYVDLLKIVSLPESVVSSLVGESPYLVPTEWRFDESGNETVNTIAVTALLVASTSVSPSDLERLVNALSMIGTNFTDNRDAKYEIHPAQAAIRLSPVPLHRGLRSYLISEGFLQPDYLVPLVLFFAGAFICLSIYAQSRANTYDRLGNIGSADGFLAYKIFNGIARMGSISIMVVVFGACLILLTEVLEHFETAYARDNNIANEFADMRFQETMFWVFRFMGAGDPGDVFPASPIGRMIAMALPFFGIGAVVGVGFLWLEKHRTKLAESRRGTLQKKLKDHILICGWNNKVKDIVFGLTSSSSPERKKVVVVADIEGDMPLADYKFDPKLVSYCRGDSADHTILERANVGAAESAIVVAGLKKRSGRNIGSVLSVMALKESFARHDEDSGTGDRSLFVAAELLYEENEAFFEACGADAVVATERVANLLAANCTLSPRVIDFVLDMLTFDEHSEIYGVSPASIGLQTPPCISNEEPRRQIDAVRRDLLHNGVNLVGFALTKNKNTSQIAHDFSYGDYLLPFDDEFSTSTRQIQQCLVISSDVASYESAARIATEGVLSQATSTSTVKQSLDSPHELRVLLAGDPRRCMDVGAMLEHVPWVRVSILTESASKIDHGSMDAHVGPFTELESWRKAGLHESDRLTILTERHENAGTDTQSNSQAGSDARTAIIARLARGFRRQLEPTRTDESLIVLGEMLELSSKSLYRDAGIATPLPSNLLAQRILLTLVYGKGVVSRFLMALLDLSDGCHLYAFSLDSSMTALHGLTFQELMNALPTSAVLLGVLPQDEELRSDCINNVGDFSFHFVTSDKLQTPKGWWASREKNHTYVSREGDELIVLLNRSSAFTPPLDV